MDNKFFTFIRPYLSFIDNGQLFRTPFSWLYIIFAALNLLVPIYVLLQAISNKFYDASAKLIIVFIFVWVIIAFAGWIGFQLWWDRRNKINMSSNEGDDFIATPVFSHLIQTFGEWLGTWIAVVGFGSALVTTIILGREGNYLSYIIGLPFIQTGWFAIIAMPIAGFLVIVASRFLSEQVRALAAIANNTRKKN